MKSALHGVAVLALAIMTAAGFARGSGVEARYLCVVSPNPDEGLSGRPAPGIIVACSAVAEATRP